MEILEILDPLRRIYNRVVASGSWSTEDREFIFFFSILFPFVTIFPFFLFSFNQTLVNDPIVTRYLSFPSLLLLFISLSFPKLKAPRKERNGLGSN